MVTTGGCRCGACRYELAEARVPPVYCCHCLDCQTWSGSAFTQQALVREERLRATGPVVGYVHANPSGSTSTQMVCSVCHTRLWNVNTARPGLVVLRAGTLDASDTIRPHFHIWTKRKQPWVTIGDDVPSFAEKAPMDAFAAITPGHADD